MNALNIFLCLLLLFGQAAFAGKGPSQDSVRKANILFERLTGVPLRDKKQIEKMAALIEEGEEEQAAAIATDDVFFYQSTVKNLVSPMGNKSETPYVVIDDFQATFIGAVRDELDARTLLTGNYIYRSMDKNLPEPSTGNNEHYEKIDESGKSYKEVLVKQENPYPRIKTMAGLLTTRGWAAAHYDGGTNRRAVQFAIQEFLCQPITAWKAGGRPDIYVGRDVERCVGGRFDEKLHRCVGDNVDPLVFKDQCSTCHTGMDAFRGAYAGQDYINKNYIQLPKDKVAPKYRNNSQTYPDGFVTTDERWTNLIEPSENDSLGFKPEFYGKPMNGIQTFGALLASSEGFKKCMARRVFTQVCQHQPLAFQEEIVKVLANQFEADNFNLKKLFQKAAVLPACLGE